MDEADSWDGLVEARMPSTEIGAGRPSLPLSNADLFLVHDFGGVCTMKFGEVVT